MSRRFSHARIPVGRFVSSGKATSMPGHSTYAGASAMVRSIDRQDELIPLIMAERARRRALADCERRPLALDFPPAAPNDPAPPATRRTFQAIATLTGAVRRIFRSI